MYCPDKLLSPTEKAQEEGRNRYQKINLGIFQFSYYEKN